MNKTFISDQEYKDLDFTRQSLQISEFENCSFIRCNFASADLSERRFENCRFEECDLSNASISKTAFQKVHFNLCKLIGLQFDTCNSFLLEFQFTKCILNYASFYQLKIPGTIFTKCTIEEADFTNSILNAATFDACILNGTMFENTQLEKADLYSSDHFIIDPERNNIWGARFSMENLDSLLTKYNIVVEK